jgi:hypothetical protein
MGLFTELISSIMMMQEIIYPVIIHLPTGSFLKTILDNNMPVMAPSGDNNKDSPRLPSVKWSLVLTEGIAATHVPNNRLDTENKKPTDKADLFFIKEEIFLIMVSAKNTILLH